MTGLTRCVTYLAEAQLLARRSSSAAASTSYLSHLASEQLGSRCFTSTSVSLQDATAASTKAKPAQSSILPSWLRTLLPGGEHLDVKPSQATPQQQQQLLGLPASSPQEQARENIPQASGSAPAEAPQTAEDQDKQKQFLEYLEQNKDLTLDGFIAMNKQLWMSAEPPRPKLPPVRRTHPDYKGFIDWKRVSYLRTMQHEKICSSMTDDEKVHVKAVGKPILKDKRFIQDIADRTGVFIDIEVKDCIQSFFDTRDHMRRLYRWVVVLGYPEPGSNEEQKKALEEMKALEEDEERLEKLEKQDRSRCPIVPVLDFMGHDATCSLTGLKYHECCGGAQGRPQALVDRDKARSIKKYRGRKVPRSERALRKAMDDRGEELKWES